MLTTRMRMILKKLMLVDSPLTGKFLAQLNKVTARTTREDIKKLDSLIRQYGAKVEAVVSKGYQLTIFDEEKFRDFLHTIVHLEDQKNRSISQLPEDREIQIIRRLLVTKGYVKLEQLADELYVSKSTVQNDLKQVKERLKLYSIQIHARPNYGLKLQGDELKLRFCMAEYIVDRTHRHGEHPHHPAIPSIRKEDFVAIDNIIMEQIKQNHISMSDVAIQNLLIHILIAYERIKDGKYITLQSSELEQIVNQSEYEVAKRIVQNVERHLHIQFPHSETAYIAIHLLGTKMIAPLEQAGGLEENLVAPDILPIIMQMLKKIDEEYHLGIQHDKELIVALGLHLKPAINRYKYGMNIRNPLLADIKKSYPLAFESAVLGGIIIEKMTGSEFDENEIGYISLHIGAAMERKNFHTGPKRCLIVCASGFGTAQLIYYKVKTEFRDAVEVIGVIELYKLKDYQLSNIDFIISSVAIDQDIGIPVIRVNAILEKSDMENITSFIHDQESIRTYFQPQLVFLQQDLKNRDEILHYLYQQINQMGLVPNSYLEHIYEREEIAATSYGNLVAIPHPVMPQSKKTFLTVCTLKRAVDWGGKPVQFICLLNVQKDSKEDLQGMYDLLGTIVNSEKIVQRLIQATDYYDFIRVLDEYRN
ncbi:BglG family transcription antiterminator [Virgibacillus dokdonensis]|uniref:BglG family transcription antiterminator n=1 Tax=Virgibacillus dokdonensis TaxID=302167 RepID=UPI0011326831|nr:BglG family transcription antiterminator [Virgibacillus dokdonensis]